MPNFIRMVQKYGQSMCYVVKYINTKSIYQKKNSRVILLRINKKHKFIFVLQLQLWKLLCSSRPQW